MLQLDAAMNATPPSATRLRTIPERPHLLSGLAVLEHLARHSQVEFNRPRARQLASEWLSPAVLSSLPHDRRIGRLQSLLASSGLHGRVCQLTLAEAIAACRDGAQLTTAIPVGTDEHQAWLLLRGARRDKVRLATEQGPDAWLLASEVADLLAQETPDAPLAWLLAEKALPCHLEATSQAAHHSDDSHEDARHGVPPLRRLLKPEISPRFPASFPSRPRDR